MSGFGESEVGCVSLNPLKSILKVADETNLVVKSTEILLLAQRVRDMPSHALVL